jgi:hypothetical protein
MYFDIIFIPSLIKSLIYQNRKKKMLKKLHFSAIAVILILVMVSSCKTSNDVASNKLIQKRKYTKGFYVNSHKRDKSKPAKTTVSYSKNEIEKELINDKLTSDLIVFNEEIQKSDTQKNSKKKQKYSDEEKIQITLKGLINESNEITNKKFAKINKKIARIFTQQDPPVRNMTPAVRKLEVLGLIGFFSGLIGIFVAGLLFGSAAIILGIISLNKFSRKPGMYKGKGWAIVGLILGIIGLIASIIIIMASV